jgi:hypothetical protein
VALRALSSSLGAPGYFPHGISVLFLVELARAMALRH